MACQVAENIMVIPDDIENLLDEIEENETKTSLKERHRIEETTNYIGVSFDFETKKYIATYTDDYDDTIYNIPSFETAQAAAHGIDVIAIIKAKYTYNSNIKLNDKTKFTKELQSIEESKRKRGEKEKKKIEDDIKKMQMEMQETTLKRLRNQRSCRGSPPREMPACYTPPDIDVNQQIRINISDIKRSHSLLAQGYLRQLIENITLYLDVSPDIINQIIYFYAKPLPLKIKYSGKIKYILYCPVHDSLSILNEQIDWLFCDRGQRRELNLQIVEFDNNYAWNEWEYDRDRIFIAKGEAERFFNINHILATPSVSYSSLSSDHDDPILSLKEQLKDFYKIAANGQSFLRYLGEKRKKSQDRIVKVSFNDGNKPIQISWGCGSRYINFDDILYISWGHYTPAFVARKNQLDPKLCFSVVSNEKILDLQARSKETTELWVKGLRKLIGQSDETADNLAKQGLEGFTNTN